MLNIESMITSLWACPINSHSQSRLVREERTCRTELFSVSITANPLFVPTASLREREGERGGERWREGGGEVERGGGRGGEGEERGRERGGEVERGGGGVERGGGGGERGSEREREGGGERERERERESKVYIINHSYITIMFER